MYQSRRKRRYFWIIFLFLIIILLNVPFVKSLPPIKFARKATLSVLYPFQFVFSKASSWTLGTAGAIINLRGLSKENSALKAELDRLLAKEKLFESLNKENEKLKESLKFKSSSPHKAKLLGANIVARSPSNWFEVVEINRGTKDGVKEDMTVINKDGLVGRTVEVARNTSKVILITDPGSSIGGQNRVSRDLGIIVGGAMEKLRMNYVVPAAMIKEGDIIETSGVGHVFPKGIPIGKVTMVRMRDYDIFKQVEIEPLVDFSKLEHVFVILSSQ